MSRTSLKAQASKNDEIIVEVTQEQYENSLARGLTPDETLAPGMHKFVRGGFRKRHPSFDATKAAVKVEVTLLLDYEVLNYFKQVAGETGAVSSEALMKQVLCAAMERGKADSKAIAKKNGQTGTRRRAA